MLFCQDVALHEKAVHTLYKKLAEQKDKLDSESSLKDIAQAAMKTCDLFAVSSQSFRY